MKKKLVRLTESDLRNIVETSISRLLKEYNDGEDSYYGGGLPDSNNDEDDKPENDRITLDDIAIIKKCLDKIYEIVNNKNDDCVGLFSALDVLEDFVETKKQELSVY